MNETTQNTLAGILAEALVLASETYEQPEQQREDALVALTNMARSSIRDALSYELSKLLDMACQAQEWNAAIETAIRLIENQE